VSPGLLIRNRWAIRWTRCAHCIPMLVRQLCDTCTKVCRPVPRGKLRKDSLTWPKPPRYRSKEPAHARTRLRLRAPCRETSRARAQVRARGPRARRHRERSRLPWASPASPRPAEPAASAETPGLPPTLTGPAGGSSERGAFLDRGESASAGLVAVARRHRFRGMRRAEETRRAGLPTAQSPSGHDGLSNRGRGKR